MGLKILPKKVFMDLARSEFGMEQQSELLSVRTLLMYSIDYGLPIYFDDDVAGVDINIHIGELFDDDGGLIDYVTAEPDDVAKTDGAKKLENAFAYSSADSFMSNEENIYVAIDRFSHNDIIYQLVNDSGDKISDLSVYYKRLYFNKEEFSTFKAAMESGDKLANLSVAKDNISSGEMKALALIAREMAEKTNKYKTGSKVNSSAIKDHLLELAKTYKISESGLKTLDDKLNKALDKYDIKEIVDP